MKDDGRQKTEYARVIPAYKLLGKGICPKCYSKMKSRDSFFTLECMICHAAYRFEDCEGVWHKIK